MSPDQITIRCQRQSGGKPGSVGAAPNTKPGPVAERVCAVGAVRVDCVVSGRVWSDARTCHADRSRPVVNGAREVSCAQPACATSAFARRVSALVLRGLPGSRPGCDGSIMTWTEQAAAVKTVAAAPVDQVVESVIAKMLLTTPDFLTAPRATEIDPNSTTLVGLPIWMWLPDASKVRATRERTSTADDGALGVQVTARLIAMEYTMVPIGGGNRVSQRAVCEGTAVAGTVFNPRVRAADSPTCGIPAAKNTRVGRYRIDAQATWHVTYAATTGETGELDHVSTMRSQTINVRELQVIVNE